MTYKTHIAGGLLLASVFLVKKEISQDELITITAVTTAGSLLPDIDKVGSRASNANIGTKAVSGATQFIFGHRGFIHSPLFLIILLGICQAAAPEDIKNMALWFALGFISHLILDTLNPGGIRWFFPVKKRISVDVCCTRSLTEYVIFILLCVGTAYIYTMYLK